MHILLFVSFFISSSFIEFCQAKFNIENPSRSALRDNKKLLENRVIQITTTLLDPKKEYEHSEFCSGTWIEKGIILTARHCIDSLASTKIEINHVSTKIIHIISPEIKSFNFSDDRYDFALILVDHENLKNLKLPQDSITFHDLASPIYDETELMISGYGQTRYSKSKSYDHLHAAIIHSKMIKEKADALSSIAQRKLLLRLKKKANTSLLNPLDPLKALLGEIELANGNTYESSFDSSNSLNEPSISFGDSGAPVFAKNRNNEWSLVGINSNVQFIPDFNEKCIITTKNNGIKQRYDHLFSSEQAIKPGKTFLAAAFSTVIEQFIKLSKLNPFFITENEFDMIFEMEGKIQSNYIWINDPKLENSIFKAIQKLKKIQDQNINFI